jgi:hypothetical protein
MIDRLSMTVTGVDEVVAKVKEIGGKKANLALRRATSRSATILLQTTRPLVPADSKESTGLLRKSLGKKDSNQLAKKAYALLGPRRGFKMMVSSAAAKQRQTRRIAKLRKSGVFVRPSNRKLKGKIKNPTRYSHALQKGHRGPGGSGFVRGRPFMMAGRLIAQQAMANATKLILTHFLIEQANTSTGDI